MLRIKENNKPVLPNEKTKLIHEKSLLTTYGTFTLCESPFTAKQAEATAVWWLNTVKNTVPTVLTAFFLKKTDPIQLTAEQEKIFIDTLTHSIIQECQKPKYLKQNKNFKMSYKGAHWDLVNSAMNAIQLSIKDGESITRGITTIMYPDEVACYMVGNQYGEIYKPENTAEHSNQNYILKY